MHRHCSKNSVAGIVKGFVRYSNNPFVPNAPFLYLLKTSENLTVIDLTVFDLTVF